jgi:DNA-binding PadR family transcriptional regulator
MSPPLKPLVFQILLALVDGEKHGWALVRDVQQRGGFDEVMPGNFYRTLRALLADGLIEDAPNRDKTKARDGGERRRYFRLTAAGSGAAATEARRLEALVLESRAKRLLTRRG